MTYFFFAFRSWVWTGVLRAVSNTLIPPPSDTRSAVHRGNEARERGGLRTAEMELERGTQNPWKFRVCTEQCKITEC